VLISKRWLEELLHGPLPEDTTLSGAITSLGLEVEGVRAVGAAVTDVVVGVVLEKSPHPQAERLTLVKLDAGPGLGTVPVVCGASNVPAPGGRVAFAPEGAELPGGFRIEARPIRGQESRGMICSEQELDIGPDADGILVLPGDWAAGDRLVDRVPGIIDTILELSITPNRPDALGHVGVARDLAIVLGRPFHPRKHTMPEAHREAGLVTLDAPDRCGRYFGLAFEGAKVGRSPLWLRVRLHRLGLRAINDVVDVTNLVLMEQGQPLHAFDRARLHEGRVVVRRASEGETLETLDGQTAELSTDDLVIADGARPQALAGVMGGASSGVDEGTTTLLLEGAWFHPSGVRRTSRRHQILTDSSHRFERGVDHGAGLEQAVARAAELFVELTGARLVANAEAVGELPAVPEIELRPARTTRVLGMPVPEDDALRILAGLGVQVDRTDPQRWRCRPPTHRPDLQREEDLIEELMRHHGLDELPATPAMPTAPTLPAPTAVYDPAGALAREHVDRLVDAFAAGGLHETIGLAFADPERIEAVFGDRALAASVALENPMRGQASRLRVDLLPGVLDAVALNLARHGRAVRLFEVGRVYAWSDPGLGRWPHAPLPDGPTAAVDRTLPRERLMAQVAIAGGADSPIPSSAITEIVLDALARFGAPARVRAAEESERFAAMHPGAQAIVEVAGDAVGHVGRLHPRIHALWDLPESTVVWLARLEVDRLPVPAPPPFRALPRFPATSRDLSLDVALAVPAATILDALRTAETELASDEGDLDPPRLSPGDRGTGADIEVVDDYRGAGVTEGRRALLVRLHYRARDRSVTDEEVQRRHAAVVTAAVARLRALDPTVAPR
jgi:phenylalanyl-tRNA synthetase beta chain